MKSLTVQINKHFDGYSPGERIEVKCDEAGIPVDNSWRRRLQDAPFDRCCEIIKTANKKPLSKPKKNTKFKDNLETE